MSVFKNQKTGKVEQLQAADIESCKFMPRARGHCLKLRMQDGSAHKYDGFKESVGVIGFAHANIAFGSH